MSKRSNELIILSALIFIFILIRSIHYVYHMNWSSDQAVFATETLRLFQAKTITLIGPPISANFQGHFIFQGPVIYYMFLFFLLLGGWDPVISSYLFVIFCALMIFPLYYGMKKLTNVKSAWIMVIIYALVPYYINYSRFLWNSTIQFSLLPLLIFLMGVFKEKKSKKVFLFIAILLGILLQFHYQFILITACFFFYFVFIKKLSRSYIFLFIIGNMIGFAPLIIFEVRHDFYHIRTILLFLQNFKALDRPGGLTMPHYYISLSFMAIFAAVATFSKKIKSLSPRIVIIAAIVLGLFSLARNIQKPVHSYWAAATPWNYYDEKKIYDIIRSTKITKDFNIANIAYYDTKAYVVKYFMKRDGYTINYDDYYNNKYLFVITEGDKYVEALSYEVAFFTPRRIIDRWQINSRYQLLLMERT